MRNSTESTPTIAILVDYRGAFWSSTENMSTLTTMDCRKLQDALEAIGLRSVVLGFSEVDLRREWRGVPVIYTSSEDPDLEYKSYIEDVVLALDRLGAVLLPRFDLLRAHHNKVFMEMLRRVLIPEDPLCDTTVYGTVEEYRRARDRPHPPVFVKAAAGAGSAAVHFAANNFGVAAAVRRVSRTGRGPGAVRSAAKVVLRPGFVPYSAYRRKFVVQKAIPGLKGDFKVLRYGDRYYALYRRNRRSSPRASGACLWDLDVSRWVDPAELLSYAGDVAAKIDSPFLSLDIANTPSGMRLLEFQAVCFGPATLQRGTHHFIATQDGFTRRPNHLLLEEVFAEAVGTALSIDARPGRWAGSDE